MARAWAHLARGTAGARGHRAHRGSSGSQGWSLPPGAPARFLPPSANLYRRPGPRADFLVLLARSVTHPSPLGTCCPCARVVDFATPQCGAGPVFVGSAPMSQRRAGRGRMWLDVWRQPRAVPCGLSWPPPAPLASPPAPSRHLLPPKHTELRPCLLAFAPVLCC